jgi:hypothetical protein
MLLSEGVVRPGNWSQKPSRPVANVLDLVWFRLFKEVTMVRTVYNRLVVCARASERITPEGLEQVYAMPISVSDTEIDRLIAAGELEPGTLRPLRSDLPIEPSPKQAVAD